MTDLPYAFVAEMSPFRMEAVASRYYWRHIAAYDLLTFPDFGEGELSAAQRRQALDRHTIIQRPLCALALFWAIVAFEDFFRDFGTELSQVDNIEKHYAHVGDLAVTAIKTKRIWHRPDRDAFSYLDIHTLNKNYKAVLGVDVVDPTLETRIGDLALLRHTVAHHGAVVRPIDKDRFRYYKVQPGRIINPPRDFVTNTSDFLAGIIRKFLELTKIEILSTMVDPMRPIDIDHPPRSVIDIIKLFDYFGKIPTEVSPVSGGDRYDSGEQLKLFIEQQKEVRNRLLRECLKDLR